MATVMADIKGCISLRNIQRIRQHISSRTKSSCHGSRYILQQVLHRFTEVGCRQAEPGEYTCAAIGNVYMNYRLFLLHGESKYYDVLERTLYNGLISGVSLDGGGFDKSNYTTIQEVRLRPWFFLHRYWYEITFDGRVEPVVGLVAGAVGFLTQQVKQRWYLQDMTNLEFLSELLNEKRAAR